MRSNEAPVVIAPYDPSWPARFDAEKEVLLRALAKWLVGPIEHIGSTAVPGLAAKPVIDILAPVETLEHSRPAIVAAAEVGYSSLPCFFRGHLSDRCRVNMHRFARKIY